MSSLRDYGVRPKTIVRQPARDRHDSTIHACAECGLPLGEPSTLRIRGPELVDDISIDTFVTRGWTCDHHGYSIVHPLPTDPAASNLSRDWTAVRIRFADGVTRHVAVPTRVIR